ncbi:MAG: hypothetical protein VKL39_21675 [Leptolyngbyaceae bacterium]|nr:hypothetical protein [Leptolyngbyaceae bacterium]
MYSKKIGDIPEGETVTLVENPGLGSDARKVNYKGVTGWLPTSGVNGLKTLDNRFVVTKETGGTEFVTTEEYEEQEKKNIAPLLLIFAALFVFSN